MEAGSPTSRPKGDEPKSKIDGGTLIVAVGVVDRAKLIIVKASLGGGGSELRYGRIWELIALREHVNAFIQTPDVIRCTPIAQNHTRFITRASEDVDNSEILVLIQAIGLDLELKHPWGKIQIGFIQGPVPEATYG